MVFSACQNTGKHCAIQLAVNRPRQNQRESSQTVGRATVQARLAAIVSPESPRHAERCTLLLDGADVAVGKPSCGAWPGRSSVLFPRTSPNVSSNCSSDLPRAT